MSAPDDLQNRAHASRPYELIAHWPDVVTEPWDQAIVHGHTAQFATTGEMLAELAALDNDSALHCRLNRFASPDVPVIDRPFAQS